MKRENNIKFGKMAIEWLRSTHPNCSEFLLSLSKNDSTLRVVGIDLKSGSDAPMLGPIVKTFGSRFMPKCGYDMTLVPLSSAEWAKVKARTLELPAGYMSARDLISFEPPICDILLMCATQTGSSLNWVGRTSADW